MLTVIMNRALCQMHLFNYLECMNDCNRVVTSIQKMSNEQQLENLSILIKAKLRRVICLAWQGDLQPAQDELQRTQDKLSESSLHNSKQIKEQIQIVKEQITKRQESIAIKENGDKNFKNAQFNQAMNDYHQALAKDPQNEIVLGNISMCHLKLSEYENCNEYCDKAIKIMKKLTSYTNFNPAFANSSLITVFLLNKLYYRKSKSLLNLDMLDEANDYAKLILKYEEKNKEVIELQQNIQAKIIRNEVGKLKQSAAEHVQEKKYQDALDIYAQCLQKIQQNHTEDIIEYLSVLLNKATCHLHLNELDDIISNCIRGIKIIKNFKGKVIAFDKQQASKEQKDKIQNFEVRFLIRRGNAYLKQNQIYNAKIDLQEALKLDPNNEQLKKDIDQLNMNIK